MSLERIALALVASLCLASAAQAKRVDKGSTVSFVAKITAGSFVANSAAVSGTVDYDTAAHKLKRADIVVRADSFETGMSMRDEHMRDKYLEAAKFPEIRFTSESAVIEAKPGASGVVDGFFVIKGVKRPAKINVTVGAGSGGRLVVTSSFKLNISDYGIPQPSFTVVKMEPVIDVTLSLVFAD